MAKLLKIKEVVRCCEECLMCKENYIEVMTEDTYLACDHPLSPEGNEIDCEDFGGFSKMVSFK